MDELSYLFSQSAITAYLVVFFKFCAAFQFPCYYKYLIPSSIVALIRSTYLLLPFSFKQVEHIHVNCSCSHTVLQQTQFKRFSVYRMVTVDVVIPTGPQQTIVSQTGLERAG